MYSGSWMESLQNVSDLYEFMSTLTPSEAALCAFNLLCPYDKPLPKNDNLEVMDNFFGMSGW